MARQWSLAIWQTRRGIQQIRTMEHRSTRARCTTNMQKSRRRAKIFRRPHHHLHRDMQTHIEPVIAVELLWPR
eukprot:6578589-Karenia_brevis.AAC.1